MKYLYKKKKAKVYHYLLNRDGNNDTYCKMLSGGGLREELFIKSYSLPDKVPELKLCIMCRNNLQKP